MSGMIMTVRGPIEAADLGVTLPHEHIYITLGYNAERYDYVDQLDDDDVLADELLAFKSRGGAAIVEATLSGVGRDPVRLAQMSVRTGLSIIMGCGWYRAPYYPPEDRLERRSVADLAESLIAEIRDGVGVSGIRPGVIGEIGVQTGWVAPIEERAHRAAARAQKETGLPMLTHSALRDVGLAQLAIFEEEGVDPSRVAIGHADSYPMLDFYLRIVKRGAWVMLDNIGIKPWGRHEERLADLVRELVAAGYGERILLSQDICKIPQLQYNGGPGYTYITDHFLPRLRALGLPEPTLDALVRDNPRRWLTIDA